MKTKKTIIAFVAGIAIVSLFSFKLIYEPKKSTAEVETVQGVYVFTTSKPVKEYEYLGNVQCGAVVMSKNYEDLMPKMVKKVKDKFPNADGVIFKNNMIYECDVIKFK